jgi:DNA-binding LacI/PurR family transcriptional regulator
MGCRKIAFVSTNTFATAGTLSHQGYCQAMRDFGIPDDQLFEVNIPLANSARPAFEAVCKLFKDAISQCDALFTAHFSMTYGAYRALEKLELLDKVTLLGTDADFNPVMHDISYMSQSYEEIGREAVNLLLGMYDNKTDHPGKIMVQPRLTHAQPSPWYGYFE